MGPTPTALGVAAAYPLSTSSLAKRAGSSRSSECTRKSRCAEASPPSAKQQRTAPRVWIPTPSVCPLVPSATEIHDGSDADRARRRGCIPAIYFVPCEASRLDHIIMDEKVSLFPLSQIRTCKLEAIHSLYLNLTRTQAVFRDLYASRTSAAGIGTSAHSFHKRYTLAPFHTRLDFEVAEFAQENMLNRAATNKLITLIRRCAANMEDLTIVHSADIDKQWDAAAKKCTDFKKYDVEVPYKINTDPSTLTASLGLGQDVSTQWYHLYTIWNEPWTADALWKIQSKLPDNPDAKPCPFILYADKSKLSSFGTQKAYPIIARLANVVVGIRNSDEWGGGQVVGELPCGSEDSAESGKTKYVNFKNAV
ncbi:hypothetical protein R3P38DRAFT_2807452 [Favolaschia claudopus]|uniref:Uncharacterized protein n=1 Tax=Favolaschia claudopus TaxID=2862362 RepID=A0AAV9ZH87_9AGAR